MEYTPEGVSEPVKIDKQKKKYQYVSHYKDLTDQRFGMLTALAKVPNANAKHAVWHCRCDCGNECDVKKTQLERGSIQDCGCASNKRFTESDLTGKRFGNLMVVERLTEKNYRCVCDCGNEKAVLASSLLSGKTTSCGCMRGKRRRQDITGMRSGMVVAIEPTDVVRRTSILWRCRCDCGKEFLTEAYKISSGRIQSCGCLRNVHKVKDLTGQRFGKLVAIKRLDEKIGSSFVWLCRCDCGNETRVSTNIGMLEARMTKPPIATNTSGYNGVYNARGLWRAQITFKKKTYYLGSYSDIQDAVAARKKGEAMFEEFLDWYYNEYFPSREKCEIAE